MTKYHAKLPNKNLEKAISFTVLDDFLNIRWFYPFNPNGLEFFPEDNRLIIYGHDSQCFNQIIHQKFADALMDNNGTVRFNFRLKEGVDKAANVPKKNMGYPVKAKIITGIQNAS